MGGDIIKLFPAFMQDKDFVAATAKALDYLFVDSTYVNGAVSLPLPGNTHNAFFDDAENVLIFQNIDNGTINADINSALAQQWSVAGFTFLESLAVQRLFVKEAIKFHRIKGTPYAVVTILERYGFTSVSLTENISVPLTYSGTAIHSGLFTYSGDLKHQLFDVTLTSATNMLNLNGDAAAQLSVFSFSDSDYLRINAQGIFYWELTDTAGTRTFNIYSDLAKTDLIGTGSRAGDGVLTFAGDVNGSVTVAFTGNDTDTANTIEFLEEIRAISLINLYKKYRPELYRLYITEPAGARTITVNTLT